MPEPSTTNSSQPTSNDSTEGQDASLQRSQQRLKALLFLASTAPTPQDQRRLSNLARAQAGLVKLQQNTAQRAQLAAMPVSGSA